MLESKSEQSAGIKGVDPCEPVVTSRFVRMSGVWGGGSAAGSTKGQWWRIQARVMAYRYMSRLVPPISWWLRRRPSCR